MDAIEAPLNDLDDETMQTEYITDWRLCKSLTIYEAAAFHHGIHPKVSCGPLQRALLSSTVQRLIEAVLTGAIRTIEPCNLKTEITHNAVVVTEDIVTYFGNQTAQNSQASTKPENENKNGDTNIYELRKNSFNKMRKTIDIEPLTVKLIFNQVKQTKPKGLWNITLDTFKSEFWHRYAKENEIIKEPGAPAKK